MIDSFSTLPSPTIQGQYSQESLLSTYKRNKWIKDKSSDIVIIGAGQSGLHMASILARCGYQNVTVMEQYGSILNGIDDDEDDMRNYFDENSLIHANYDVFFDLLQLYGTDTIDFFALKNNNIE